MLLEIVKKDNTYVQYIRVPNLNEPDIKPEYENLVRQCELTGHLFDNIWKREW